MLFRSVFSAVPLHSSAFPVTVAVQGLQGIAFYHFFLHTAGADNSGKLLSEIICHGDFPRLMTDMEIFVDHIASMQIDNLNDAMDTMRGIVQKQYHPEENELFYRTAELGRIPADEYVGSVLREDLVGILRDIRKTHPKNVKDQTTASPLAAIEEFQKKVQSVIEGKGSPEEQTAKIYLAALGIEYESLTPEEFVVLIGILGKSKFKENSISRRGKKQPAPPKKRKK